MTWQSQNRTTILLFQSLGTLRAADEYVDVAVQRCGVVYLYKKFYVITGSTVSTTTKNSPNRLRNSKRKSCCQFQMETGQTFPDFLELLKGKVEQNE